MVETTKIKKRTIISERLRLNEYCSFKDTISFMVSESTSNEPIGVITLNYASGEISYLIYSNFRRKGYATEALNALVENTHGILKNTLFLRIRGNNEGSKSVAKLVGFRKKVVQTKSNSYFEIWSIES